MKIREILSDKGNKVIFIGPGVSLKDSLESMVDNKVGALPVLDAKGNVLGIITERDLMREVRMSATLEGKQVEEVMTKDIITGRLDDDLEHVMTVMTENRFRHIPVIEEGRLVGIVSIGDAVKCQLIEIKQHFEDLKSYVGPSV